MDTSEFAKLAQSILAQGQTKKPVKLVEGPAVLRDGTTFQPLPVTNASEAGRVMVVMLMKHIADMHLAVVDIISEKYDIPANEIVEAIREHPRWEEINTQPMINLLGEHDWKECPPAAGTAATRRGRPKMTEEQKAAAKAAREVKKSPPVPAPAPVAVAVPAPQTFAVVGNSVEEAKAAEAEMEILDDMPPPVVVTKKMKKKVIITNIAKDVIEFE